MKRIPSIDIVRGLVMIIMALDHTRDLIHVDSVTLNPTDLATTSPWIFFTRLITHLCAPTFVFLSGVSVWLSLKTHDVSNTKRLLWTRGLWLILMELTVVTFGIWFDIHFGVLLFGVIAAIGFGFIILSWLIKLPRKFHLILGLAIIILHNLLPVVFAGQNSILITILNPLFGPAVFPVSATTTFVMGYSPIPWLGIMLTGFGIGYLFEKPIEIRKKIFLQIGMISLVLFLLGRYINFYGDPAPWSSQKDSLFTLLSFLNVTKYPPSLLFCLLTLGTMFMLLWIVEGINNRITNVLIVYGKVPLFYFLVHWYIIHPVMFLIIFAQGYGVKDLVFGFNFGRPKGPSGLELGGVYLVWIFVVVSMYPLCLWYGKYKANHPDKRWLKYL